MNEIKIGRMLAEHQESLVEAGLDEDTARALVDDFESELNAIFEEDQEESDQEGQEDDQENNEL